jgi:hypothetical protein
LIAEVIKGKLQTASREFTNISLFNYSVPFAYPLKLAFLWYSFTDFIAATMPPRKRRAIGEVQSKVKELNKSAEEKLPRRGAENLQRCARELLHLELQRQ